jgi:hypothetical protein
MYLDILDAVVWPHKKKLGEEKINLLPNVTHLIRSEWVTEALLQLNHGAILLGLHNSVGSLSLCSLSLGCFDLVF